MLLCQLSIDFYEKFPYKSVYLFCMQNEYFGINIDFLL